MRAKLVKTLNGKVVSSVEKSFSDVPSLAKFLKTNGMKLEYADIVSDLGREEVVYTVAYKAEGEHVGH